MTFSAQEEFSKILDDTISRLGQEFDAWVAALETSAETERQKREEFKNFLIADFSAKAVTVITSPITNPDQGTTQ